MNNNRHEQNLSSRSFKKYLLVGAVVLIISNAATAWFVYREYQGNFDEVAKYPHIDFSRHFIDQKHYLPTINPLRTKIRELARELENSGRTVTLYIEYINTGANISVNQDTYIFPASLVKLPIAMAVMKRVQDGDWLLTNELVLLEGDKDVLSGDQNNLLGKYAIGTRFTIAELLQMSLSESDNTAMAILLRNVGERELDSVVDALGLEKLFNENGAISAKEYSRILRSLYSASYLNRENSEYLLTLLDSSTFNDFITYGLEEQISFPHKYGEHIERRIYADSGIAYLQNRPYLLTVVIKGVETVPYEIDRNVAVAFMRAISDESYSYFSSANNE